MAGVLVLCCLGLGLVGCVWTARRYRRAQRAALPAPLPLVGPIGVRAALLSDEPLEGA